MGCCNCTICSARGRRFVCVFGGLCLFTIASLDPHYSRLYPTPEIVTVNTADKAESDLIRTPSFSCCDCVGDRKVPGSIPRPRVRTDWAGPARAKMQFRNKGGGSLDWLRFTRVKVCVPIRTRKNRLLLAHCVLWLSGFVAGGLRAISLSETPCWCMKIAYELLQTNKQTTHDETE